MSSRMSSFESRDTTEATHSSTVGWVTLAAEASRSRPTSIHLSPAFDQSIREGEECRTGIQSGGDAFVAVRSDAHGKPADSRQSLPDRATPRRDDWRADVPGFNGPTAVLPRFRPNSIHSGVEASAPRKRCGTASSRTGSSSVPELGGAARVRAGHRQKEARRRGT